MIPLTISNATHTWQVQRQVDETDTIDDLLEALAADLHLPLPDEQSQLGDLVTVAGNDMALYHPRHGILDVEKRVAEYAALHDETLILHVDYELVDLVSTLRLSEEQPFNEMLRMVTLNWHNEYFPILLPAQATPQGNIEGSLMSTLIIEQLNQIRDVYIDPGTIPHGQFYNARTQRLIQPLDRVTLIGEQVRHGDMLEYRTDYAMPTTVPAPDLDIVILDDADTIGSLAPQADSAILDEISISPVAESLPNPVEADVIEAQVEVPELEVPELDTATAEQTEQADVVPEADEAVDDAGDEVAVAPVDEIAEEAGDEEGKESTDAEGAA